MKEVWKDIAGYDGLYQVSSKGRVKSCEREVRMRGNRVTVLSEMILKPWKTKEGYMKVALFKNGVRRLPYVHRLVATAFIPNHDLFADTVNHKDECKTNNVVTNLEWLSKETT